MRTHKGGEKYLTVHKSFEITDTSNDSPPFKNEISFWREARRNFLTFCAEGAEKILLRALLFLVQEAIATHAATDFGRRVEQSWPYYFLCRRL